MNTSDRPSAWARFNEACVATPRDRRNIWRFVLWLFLWMAAFVAAQEILSVETLAAGTWRVLVALAPSLIGIVCIASFVRFVRQADELLRKIQLEALAIAVGVGAVAVIGYRLLETAGAPRIDAPFYLAAMLMTWAAATVVGMFRYGS